MELYGIRAGAGFATQGGRVITHTSRAELEWLFPTSKIEALSLSPQTLAIPLPMVRGMEPVTFPLNRRRFQSWN